MNQLTIDSTGGFSLVDDQCTVTGSATPRAGGKNIFNMSASFAGDCLVSGTVSGVAYLDTATMQLVALALNAGKTDGLIVVGNKR